MGINNRNVVVQMRQTGNGIGLLVVSILVLVTNWFFSPFGVKPLSPTIFFWVATVFFGLVLCLSIIAVFYSEKYLFASNQVEYRNGFGETRTLHFGTTLFLRIRAASPQARRTGTRVYPYEVILLGKDKSESKILFLFQSKDIAKKFIQALSEKVPLELADVIQDDFFNERNLKEF